MKTPSSPNNLIEIFVGVDIGKSFHCAAAINGRGNVLLKPLKVIASAEGFAAFEARLRQLGDKTAVLIGLESFCAGSGVLSATSWPTPSAGSPD